MTSQDTLTRLQDCIAKGYGRRRLAKELGVTPHKARQLMQDFIPPKQIEVKAKKTAIKLDESKIIKSKPSNSTTRIELVSNAQIDETPGSVRVRPISLRVACVSDIHYPYQDIVAEEIALSYIKDWKPDILVWNGDIFDFYAVSNYEKSIKKKMNIQEEIDYGHSRMSMWVKELGETQHYFRRGNHETRLNRMIMKNAPALEALRSTAIEQNIDFDSIGVKYIPDHQDLHIGNMMFIHGSQVRRHGGNSSRGHYEQYGCSLLMGHTHRLAVTYKRNKFGTHTLVENGTLCDFDVEYAQFPDWQQGFTCLQYDGDDFSVTQHAIINHKLIADGRVYVS